MYIGVNGYGVGRTETEGGRRVCIQAPCVLSFMYTHMCTKNSRARSGVQRHLAGPGQVHQVRAMRGRLREGAGHRCVSARVRGCACVPLLFVVRPRVFEPAPPHTTTSVTNPTPTPTTSNKGAIGFVGRGDQERVSTVQGLPLDLTKCIECGQCAAICPTGAMRERHDLFEVCIRVYACE